MRISGEQSNRTRNEAGFLTVVQLGQVTAYPYEHWSVYVREMSLPEYMIDVHPPV